MKQKKQIYTEVLCTRAQKGEPREKKTILDGGVFLRAFKSVEGTTVEYQ